MTQDQFISCVRLMELSNRCNDIGACVPDSDRGNAYCCCNDVDDKYETMENGLGCRKKNP